MAEKDYLFNREQGTELIAAVHGLGQSLLVSQDAIKVYSENAAKSAESALSYKTDAASSASSASASKDSAAVSATAAAESAKSAMSATPDGYADLAATFNSLGLYKDADGDICQKEE